MNAHEQHPAFAQGAQHAASVAACASCPLRAREPDPPLPFKFANPYAFGALVWDYMAKHKDAPWQKDVKAGSSLAFQLAARELIAGMIAAGDADAPAADDIERILEWHFDKGSVAQSKLAFEALVAASSAAS